MNNALEITHGRRPWVTVMARGKSNEKPLRDGARMVVTVGLILMMLWRTNNVAYSCLKAHVPAPPVGRVLFRAPHAKTPGNKVHTPFSSGDLLA